MDINLTNFKNSFRNLVKNGQATESLLAMAEVLKEDDSEANDIQMAMRYALANKLTEGIRT